MDDCFEGFLFFLVIILLIVVVNHDNTFTENDEKLALTLYKNKVSLEDLRMSKNLFEDFNDLEKAYLQLVYQNSIAVESRPSNR